MPAWSQARRHDTGRHRAPGGGRVVILSPGEGGIGDPWKCDPVYVQQDMKNKLVSAATARDNYGLDPEARAAAAE